MQALHFPIESPDLINGRNEGRVYRRAHKSFINVWPPYTEILHGLDLPPSHISRPTPCMDYWESNVRPPRNKQPYTLISEMIIYSEAFPCCWLIIVSSRPFKSSFVLFVQVMNIDVRRRRNKIASSRKETGVSNWNNLRVRCLSESFSINTWLYLVAQCRLLESPAAKSPFRCE